VTECLRDYHDRYEELFENVCHIFLLQQVEKADEKRGGFRPDASLRKS
jgi:hypothetical protein